MHPNHLGPFKINRILGRGGMGAVYEGIHQESGELAAIKMLLGSLEDSAETISRFEAEIETLKRFRHPNIVRLFGFGEEDEKLFYVMELINGASLQQEIRKSRVFHWYEVAKIGYDLCLALKHAHDRGIVHRDIKPANILLEYDGSVKLSDFGISQFFGSGKLTDANAVVGTIEYMAPEQALAAPIGPKADLYSLGAVMYALLSRKPPFRAKNITEILQHFAGEFSYEPITDFRNDVPGVFASLISDLLKIKPEDRPANAYVVGRKIHEILQSSVPDAENIYVYPSPASPANLAASPIILDKEQIADNDAPPQKTKTHIDSLGKAALDAGFLNFGTLYGEKNSPDDFSLVPRPSPRILVEEEPESLRTETTSKFFRVSEDELGGINEFQKDPPPIISGKTIVIVFFLLISGGIIWLMQQPIPADTLFNRIQSVVSNENRADFLASLRLAETNIGSFLDLYPGDSRAPKLQVYLDELELDRLEKRFERRINSLNSVGLHPAERAYLKAIAVAQTNPEIALKKFEAIVLLYGTIQQKEEDADVTQRLNTASEQSVELARRRLRILRKELDDIAKEQTELIEFRLSAADDMEQNDPTRADAIRRSVIELYSDADWAKELVKKAAAKLH